MTMQVYDIRAFRNSNAHQHWLFNTTPSKILNILLTHADLKNKKLFTERKKERHLSEEIVLNTHNPCVNLLQTIVKVTNLDSYNGKLRTKTLHSLIEMSKLRPHIINHYF